MRQCQQERRIATQLMAIRKEKETIRDNLIYRQKQYEEQRIKELNEALDKERVSTVSNKQYRIEGSFHWVKFSLSGLESIFLWSFSCMP